MEIEGPIVGIDLGTTNSEIYIVKDGKPTSCFGKHGEAMTPSRVMVDPKSELDKIKFVGGAKGRNLIRKYPQNLIYEPKRLIGRKFNDDFVKRDIFYWPFSIVEQDGCPHYKVTGNKNCDCYCTAVDVDAEILRVLKSDLNKDDNISRAVITVPSYFTNEQKEATREAGEKAGFHVEKFLPEPIAAAIAYGFSHQVRNHTILVYDLGGGTFDCCLIRVENGKYITLAYDGFSHLGGADFDNDIVHKLCEEYKKAHGYDLFQSKRDMKGLKEEAEKAKIALSGKDCTAYEIQYSPVGLTDVNPPDVYWNLTRNEFEGLIKSHINKTIDCVLRIINQTNLTKNNINDVVCVGGSTRIPFVREQIKAFFDNREIDFDAVDIDCAVAEGAAIYAHYLQQNIELLDDPSLKKANPVQGETQSIVLDSIPYDIYINEGSGYTCFFEKGKAFNDCSFIKRIRNYTATFNNMKCFTVDLFYGEKGDEKRFLGRCKLDISEPQEKKNTRMSIFLTYHRDGKIECKLDNNHNDKCSKSFSMKDGKYHEENELKIYEYECEAKKMLKESLMKGNSEEVVEKRKNILEFLQYLEEDALTDDLDDIQGNYEELIVPFKYFVCCNIEHDL